MRPRSEYLPYINALAGHMRLGHWTFKISEDSPGGESSVAAIEPWPGRFVATLYFSERFLGNAPADQRYTTVHELCHCFMAHANALICNDLSRSDERAWRLAHEYGIDQIASVIAPTMPLPDEVLGPAPEKPHAMVYHPNMWGPHDNAGRPTEGFRITKEQAEVLLLGHEPFAYNHLSDWGEVNDILTGQLNKDSSFEATTHA